ncbi:MAG: hypothetical protein IPL45_13000 [Actinomycetales bacterium]|nr:hypothetical protein [Actinomycetales bacterium]
MKLTALAARGAALVAAVIVSVAGVPGAAVAADMPPAGMPPAGMPPARLAGQTDTAPSRLTLTQITPSVLAPGGTLTISGTVDAAGSPTGSGAASGAAAAVRLVRGRASIDNRTDVQTWSTGVGTATGTEVDRTPIDSRRTGGAPFTLTVGAEQLRLARPFGVVPIAVELIGERGTSLAVLRTFVGWQRAADYTPISIAWVLPVTLEADPGLRAAAPADRAAAWDAQVGPGSPLVQMLAATAGRSVTYAVDPAVLGPSSSLDQGPLAQALVAASTTNPVLALPQDDPDLAALTTADALAAAQGQLPELLGGADRLKARGIGTRVGFAWPADGTLPAGREAALRAAYGSGLSAILVSGHATDPTARLTPSTAGTAPLGTPVLRWDDRLSELFTELSTPAEATIARQLLVAQTAALHGERPSIARTFLVVAPRGATADADPGELGELLRSADRIPWVRTVGLDVALRPGIGPDAARALPTATTPGNTPATATDIGGAKSPLTPGTLSRIATQQTLLSTLSTVLDPTSPTMGRWHDIGSDLVSVRWRDRPSEHATVLDQLARSTATVADGLSVSPQSANFLADEGVLQVTIVNDLDEPVHGIRAVLTPGNARMYVVEAGQPVDVAARAKATVQIRLAAVAQGLVPISAWIETLDGTRIGRTEQISVQAAPPGAWLYVSMWTAFGLILLVGIIRTLRRPPRTTAELGVIALDPVDPMPEVPLVAPVVRHPAP